VKNYKLWCKTEILDLTQMIKNFLIFVRYRYGVLGFARRQNAAHTLNDLYTEADLTWMA